MAFDWGRAGAGAATGAQIGSMFAPGWGTAIGAGLGAGSSRSDFDAVGIDFSRRFRILSEALPMIRRLLRGEEVAGAQLPSWSNARPIALP